MPKIISKERKLSIKRCFAQIQQDRPDLTKAEMYLRLTNIFKASRNTIIDIIKTNDADVRSSIGRKKLKWSIFDDHILKKDLQRIIWKYNSNNEFYTLDKLLIDAKETIGFQGRRTMLHEIIKSMGYKYKKVNGRAILCEKSHVIKARLTFLRKFLQLKHSSENYIFIYLDETWIYQNGASIRRWVHDSDLQSNPQNNKSEGTRFTVLHAGSETGFLEGCEFLLHSKNNDADYHKTMDGALFKKWVTEQLLPALALLRQKCVIVMDNAPYHSVLVDKPPTASSKKSHMQDWLRSQKVNFDSRLTKKKLWTLIAPMRDNSKRYEIDELLASKGHVVLRLPPYHCQYNPIEMAWGFCKQYYNKCIGSHLSTRDRVSRLWTEALSKCTPVMWNNFCGHCDKLIQEDWKNLMGNLPFDNVPPIIIALEKSDESSADDCSDIDDPMLSN